MLRAEDEHWAFFAIGGQPRTWWPSITSAMTDMNNFLSLGFVRVRWTFGDLSSAEPRRSGVLGGRYLRPQSEELQVATRLV